MGVYRITSRTLGTVDVEAVNWLAGLGEGLARLGSAESMDRIACEALPNGQILVRDVRRGLGFVVQPLGDEPHEDTEEVEDIPVPSEPDDSDLVPASLQDELDEIVAAESPGVAIRQLLEAAVSRLASEAGAVLLVQSDDTLKFIDSVGPGAETLRNVSLPAGTGIAGFCVERGSSLTVLDAQRHPLFFPQVDRITGFFTRSILCVPIAGGGRVLGCLELLNAEDPIRFRGDGMIEAQAFAAALGHRLVMEPPAPA